MALGTLSLYLALPGRRAVTSVVAAVVVTLILCLSFDLDRPVRGLITIPDTALGEVREPMDLPLVAVP